MFKYFKMKKLETEMKYQLYSLLSTVTNEQGKIMKFVKDLYAVLKDVPTEELRKEFIHEIAAFAHEEAVKQRESETKADYNVKN